MVVRLVGLSLSVLLVSSFLGCTISSSTPTRDTETSSTAFEQGIDRPGSDYRDFDLETAEPQLCRQACEDDSRCRAFTYVKPGLQAESARCWLKDSVPEREQDDCCVSGVK